MPAFADKWGLPALAVVIGSIILRALFYAPRRGEDTPDGKVARPAVTR